MHARARRATGRAGAGDGLALFHRVALLHQQRFVVAVGGDVAGRVLDQQQVTEMGHAVAGIDHGAAVGRLDWRAVVGGDVDAVALLAAIVAVGRDDLAAQRPLEARCRAGRRRLLGVMKRRRLASSGGPRSSGGGPALPAVLSRALLGTGRRGQRLPLYRTGWTARRAALDPRRDRGRLDLLARRHVLGARHRQRLAGAQRIGCLQLVALGDALGTDPVTASDAVERVLVLDGIGRHGIGAGGGTGILHGAFTGAIEDVVHGGTRAERSRQRRRYGQRSRPTGPSRGEARGSLHEKSLLHRDSGGNPVGDDFYPCSAGALCPRSPLPPGPA